jgi:RecA-family ATPase
LVSRLKAADTDLEKVVVLNGKIACNEISQAERLINLKTDLVALRYTLTKIGDVALVVIERITAYLGATDSHKNVEIRALLAPLSNLAASHGGAVVCVSHLSKTDGSDGILRVTGSLAFVAAARAGKSCRSGVALLYVQSYNRFATDPCV